MADEVLPSTWTSRLSVQLGTALDYFIPHEMQASSASHRRARMFMLSHFFGPILGSSLPAYLYVMGISRDYRVGIFFALVLAFWIYPLLLRRTGRYQLLGFISIQNLIFCVFWACYAYGGLHSPFLPWMLIFPLLAFLYLPTTGRVRNLLIVQIFGSSLLFFTYMTSGAVLPSVDLQSLEVIGMISMASVAIYFAMMSTYFARMFDEQETFARETASIISTSGNVQQLTLAARQASVAKANFVASMSHELRTPLNSIIGYSQLLVEEAIDEDDEQSLSDLQKINMAGTHLLRLIDDILDYSRIDAGKMPVNVSRDRAGNCLALWVSTIEGRVRKGEVEVRAASVGKGDPPITTDWSIVGNIVRLLAMASVPSQTAGTLFISVNSRSAGDLQIDVAFADSNGNTSNPSLPSESFEHGHDSSATKYGGTGIESTLAQRFASLLGGAIEIAENRKGLPCIRLRIADGAISAVHQAAA